MAVEEDSNINMPIYMSVKHQEHYVITIQPTLASGMSYRHIRVQGISSQIIRFVSGY